MLDHRTVIFNLTSANLQNITQYTTEYSAKSAYDLADLSPQEWHRFVSRLENNIDGPLMGLVYQFYMKSSMAASTCDRKCRTELINCNFKTARAQDPTFCANFY